MFKLKCWLDFKKVWSEAWHGGYFEPCSGLLHEIPNVIKSCHIEDRSETVFSAIRFCLEIMKRAYSLRGTFFHELDKKPEYLLSEKAYKILILNLIQELSDTPDKYFSTELKREVDNGEKKLNAVIDVLTFLRDVNLFSDDPRHRIVYTGSVSPYIESREDFIEAVFRGVQGFGHAKLNFSNLKELLKPHLSLITEILVMQGRYDLIEEGPVFEAIIFLKHTIVKDIISITMRGGLRDRLKEEFALDDKGIRPWLESGLVDLSSDQIRIISLFGHQRVRSCLKTLMLLLFQKDARERSLVQKLGITDFQLAE